MSIEEKAIMIVEDLQRRVYANVTMRYDAIGCNYIFTLSRLEYNHYYAKMFSIEEIVNYQPHILTEIIIKEYKHAITKHFIK